MNRKILSALVLVGIVSAVGYFAQEIRSASLSNVSVTLGTSRLSFRGRLAAGNSADTTVTINTTQLLPYTSITTDELVEGDALTIGSNTYTVRERVSTSQFSITTALVSGDHDTADEVYMARTASNSARMNATSAIAGGSFRLLFPATSSGSLDDDNIPDPGYFDFGTGTPATAYCAGFTGAGTVTPTSTAGVLYGGSYYHEFKCAYTGTNTVGNTYHIGVANLINPAPVLNHTTGTADTYQVIAQHLDGGGTVIDSTTVAIGAIEAVQVTAQVAPQITFTIAGVSAATMTGSTICGVSANAVTTTATAVPFGSLGIASFLNAAQQLTVSTNASNGFAVTAIENDQMGLNGQACAGESGVTNCIDDTPSGTEATSSGSWDNASSQPGFGYSLHDHDSDTTEAFAYNEVARNFSAKQFPSADAAETESPATIFSESSVTNGDDVYVCYRIAITATQPAGLYYNFITYTATATF